MVQATSCPSAPVLQRLLLGQSADEESISLEAHLLHCDKCLQTIKSLPPDDALVSSLQEGRNSATLSPRSELLEKLRLRLQEMSASSRGGDTATAENTNPNAPFPSPELMVDESVALGPPQQPDEIGRLGGYRVLKELGRGGMGAVFQAEDPKLKRLVALKVMLPRLAADDSARRRFLREAQAMAAVHHDHVVTIYQVDEDNNVPFLAMEFLHGMPLDQWLKDGRKPNLAQILRIGREIAEGLAAAHARGLIHRDIKPGNIWLDSDHKGRVKILDFGLARVGTDDVHLTHSGAIVGTPAYMSPEQGAGQKVDARTDLFSLGCIFYRFCTGAMPFSGDTTMALLTALALADPRPVAELNPETPAALADLVMRLLAKKPADRPATAQEVADQLAAIEQNPQGIKTEEGGPTEVLAPESRPSATLAKPKSRRRTVIYALAGAAALLIAAAGAVVYVQTDRGTIEIKTADPDVKVSVEQNGNQVDVLDPQSKQQLSIHSGQYTLKLTGVDGAEHEMVIDQGTNPVTLKRGGKVVVTVNRVDKTTETAGKAPGMDKAIPDLVGTWWKLGGGDPQEVWTIKRDSGRWSAGGVYIQDGKEIGSWKGREVQFEDGKLTCIMNHNPLRPDWVENVKITATAHGDKLTYLFEFPDGNNGKNNMARFATPPGTPLDDLWVKKVRDLPPDKQVEEVAAELKRRNPGFDGKLTPSIRINSVEGLTVPTNDVTDLTPLRALAQLENLDVRPIVAGKSRLSDLSTIKDLKLTALNCDNTLISDLSPLKDMKLTVMECWWAPVHDLTPLKGMPLWKLDCSATLVSDLSPLKDMKLTDLKFGGTRVSDLSVLRGMPLTILNCGDLPISDLSPLKDMKLTYLVCSGTRISDLSPLKDMPLTELNFLNSPVSDLSPLKDMKLTRLECQGTAVSDLSVLKNMPLKVLWCDFKPERDAAILRSIKSLETINDKPAAEFWKEVEAKAAEKKP